MSTATMLEDLGVRENTLAAAERLSLDKDGFVALHGLIPPDDLAELRAHALTAAGTNEMGIQCEAFERAWAHPRVLAAVAYVLGPDFRVTRLGFRSPAPGHGAQVLHVDWREAVQPGEYVVCNAFFTLVPFTTENGATRVVPGSHRCGKLPPFSRTTQRHPGEQRLLGPAGTVFIVNGHVWHSGMANSTSEPRYMLCAGFGKPWTLLHRPEVQTRNPMLQALFES